MSKKETFHSKIKKILCEHGPLKVTDIYRFIEHIPNQNLKPNWRNSVRHALSSKKNLFQKASINNNDTNTIRGHYWRYMPTSKPPKTSKPKSREHLTIPASQLNTRTYLAIMNFYKFLYC